MRDRLPGPDVRKGCQAKGRHFESALEGKTIVTSAGATSTEKNKSPPYLAATCAGLGVLLIYILTLAPTTAWWDTSEYIATGYTLGIPHPPGNPLFVVLARTWTLLLEPFGLSPAVCVNLLAATTSAGAFFFFFLIAHRALFRAFGNYGRARVGAGAAVLIGATAYTVWSQSNANEKVYTVSLLVVAAVSWLVVRWQDLAGQPGRERRIVAAVYLMALGSTSHLMSVLPAAAVVVFAGLVHRQLLVDRSFLFRCALAVVVGLSFNFFLPIRASQRPVINEGDPLCDGFVEAAAAIYTHGRAGCPALAESLKREQYQKPPVSERMSPFGHQLHNYFQYFDWQWSRGLDPDEPASPRRLPFTLGFLVLGVAGFMTVWRGDRNTGVYFGILMLTLSLGLVYYLNFRYGYSLAPEVTGPQTHEVRERDYFFLIGFALWGVMAGVGLSALWLWLRKRLKYQLVAAPVLGLAAVPLILNLSWASRAGDFAARDWAYDLLNSVEPYGVLFTNGDNDTFPLWYLQEVEGTRRDVTVVVVEYLRTDWYPRQLRELTSPDRQRPYVPVGEDLFPVPEPPTRSVVGLTDEQIGRVVGGPLPDSIRMRLGRSVVAFPAGMILDRKHRIALSMIGSAISERPVYFAGRAGVMADLGLSPWGVREGLASKLVVRDLEGPQPPSYRLAPPELGGGWVDYTRTTRLVDHVYRYRGLLDREVWPDASTVNIPIQYYLMTGALASVAEEEGDRESARRYAEMSRGFTEAALGGSAATRSR